MQTGHDVLGTIENESGSAKHENGTRRPRYRLSIPPKTDPGAQNMKTRPDALGTTRNEVGSAKHKN
jgi:hypothetical protein